MGKVYLPWNNPKVNYRNNIIVSYLYSNYNIFWIPETSRILIILYYIFNYIIKDNIKIYKLVLTITLFKSIIKKTNIIISNLIIIKEGLIKIRLNDFYIKVYYKFNYK